MEAAFLKEKTFYSNEDLAIEGASEIDIFLSVSGNLTAKGDVTVQHNLSVRGNAKIEGNLSANIVIIEGSLTVSGDIKVSQWLVTGKGVKAKTIEAKVLHCGGTIESDWVHSTDYDVICTSLNTKQLPLGRNFWASHPTLTPWKDLISDESNCWEEFKQLSKEHLAEIETLDLGHWLLNVQFRNLLGLPVVVPKIEFAGVPQTINEDFEVRTEVVEQHNDSNALWIILNDKTKTAYPDYSANPAYQALVEVIKMDLRAAYLDETRSINDLIIKINACTDDDLKAKLLDEVGAVSNVRSMVQQHHNFINDAFLTQGDRLSLVASLCHTSNHDAIVFDCLSMFTTVIGLVDIKGIGAVASLMLSVLNLIKDTGEGDPIKCTYENLAGQLADSFNNAIKQNARIETLVVSDYGKLQKVNNLIISGALKWTAEQQATASGYAANKYEERIWITLLSINWWPTYSYFSYHAPKASGCGNTVYMPRHSECGWASSKSTYVPYWLVCGGGRWWCNGVDGIANRLKEIGVGMSTVIRGDGAWGPPFDKFRKHPCGQQMQPTCVKYS